MRTTRKRSRTAGFVSYAMVIATGAFLTMMMLYAYRRALASQAAQAKVQLRIDYSEKEDAVLRSLVAIVPNRAMRSMQNSSAVANANRDTLTWQTIFGDALTQANARASISADLKIKAGGSGALMMANSGDSALATTNLMFTNVHGAANSVYVTPGINRTLGTGFPSALITANPTTIANDLIYPIIANDKNYGNDSAGKPVTYTLLKYPKINFGYAKPGDDFVAKRNWWAFSMDVADHDDTLTSTPVNRRQFVMSIYEIPSTLAISAGSFMSLGKYASGVNWQNVTIDGNIFVGRAQVEGGASFPTLASRRSVSMGSGAKIGGQSFTGSPFTPGVREQYEVTTGEFFPVSMPSESGRAAFIPINRGADFFDMYADANYLGEANTLSPTSWNNYSCGALQAAMRLTVSASTAGGNLPTQLKLDYLKSGVRQTPLILNLTETAGTTNVPDGYKLVAAENGTYNFPSSVDVAYGYPGKGFAFQTNVSGTVTFSNTTFGDPASGYVKSGYYRPRAFVSAASAVGKTCITVCPKRLTELVTNAGGDGPEVNNSVVVNPNYRSGTNVKRPTATGVATAASSYEVGVILDEADDLTSFPKGFSLVTNLRLYIGSDFNTKPITGTTTYPPFSLFAPEVRYGVDSVPYSVSLSGQIGSLASDAAATSDKAVHPFDLKGRDDVLLNPSQNSVNLKPISRVVDVPPIVMMNWLVLIEERRKEFY